MNQLRLWIACMLVTSLTACGIIRDSPRYSFSDGYYKSNLVDHKIRKVYVDNSDDSIRVYPLAKGDTAKQIDSSSRFRISFPQLHSNSPVSTHTYRKPSFDVDFVTIPFKYRPTVDSFPAQFNTTLNGAVFVGYRNDVYQLSYKMNPIGGYDKKTTHFGYSIGFFAGFGGTAMNPWVTNYRISSEYDGVVWTKGLSGIIGVNNFTVGLALGWDNLLDNNKKYWIYQNKAWLGLAFGLNLN